MQGNAFLCMWGGLDWDIFLLMPVKEKTILSNNGFKV